MGAASCRSIRFNTLVHCPCCYYDANYVDIFDLTEYHDVYLVVYYHIGESECYMHWQTIPWQCVIFTGIFLG